MNIVILSKILKEWNMLIYQDACLSLCRWVVILLLKCEDVNAKDIN